ncbi:hypothetical protein [Gordonia sp. UCD-TK1]|uniref:hypothetical protein n=1 Tax=Gordonia sp. UCD-TK1 TaxID=1857893 RepID=UPI000A8A58B8|nr:hypothetical protein [Gordonia sp. UCD-TK1]
MNQAVAAGFVWQILLLSGLVYWSRFGLAAVIDAATQPVRAVRWQPHPELGPTPPPARFKWIIGLVGVATLPVGVVIGGLCALWRITAGSWPSAGFVGAGWTLAVLGWLILLMVGEMSIAKELGPGRTIRAALHRHRHRSLLGS